MAEAVTWASGEAPALFPQWRSAEQAARARRAALASVGLHLAAVAVLWFTPLGRTGVHDVTRTLVELRTPFTLVAPPAELTQRDPNTGRVGKEFTLESLLPRRRVFVPPASPPGAPAAAPAAIPEPPRLEAAFGEPGPIPLGNAVRGLEIPPPQIQPVEKPRLPYEAQGAPRGVGAVKQPGSPIPPTGASIAEMARDLARGRNTAAQIVEDFGVMPGGIEGAFGVEVPRGRTGSSLELLSDPRGVDFKPYLTQILASVKRNWMAVIPESAKLGRRGRVVIQFMIARDGSVPRLVIASASGTEALDRAAVAGISATNPFPPLPAEFRGENVRLQFVFLYNMPPN